MAVPRSHLTAHLTVASQRGLLAFRSDCPLCRELGERAPARRRGLVPRRVRTGLAAALVAVAAVFSSAPALAIDPVEDEEGATEPGAPQRPGDEPLEFDPGAEEELEPEQLPPAPVEGGDESDEGEGAPIEAEPDGTPTVPQATPAPVPEALPAPTPESAPGPPTPPAPVAPAPPPATPPAVAPEVPLRERARAVQPPPLLVAPLPPRAGDGDEGGLRVLPQSVGGRQPDRPPVDYPAAPATTPVEPESTAGPPGVGGATADRAGRPQAGEVHVVRAGESLWSIADRLVGPGGSDLEVARMVERLWELNEQEIGTGSPDLLAVGTVLVLP